MPDSFYLREAMRRYVDLLSVAHSEMRVELNAKLENIDRLVRSYTESESTNIEACLVEHVGKKEHELISLGSSKSRALISSGYTEAPLRLEHYIMPGATVSA